ncbi:NAD(P)-binding protein [Xylaria cf. heliscus]|nr:NAD(P)-binding protein [Xylaria cf. heliscus]
MASKKVLIIGPGYIGWNILDLLVQEDYAVTGYVRRKEHGEQIKASGASKVIYGELSNRSLITRLTVAHDIVFHTATADDLPSVEAILDGIQERANSGLSTIYIHTSGTAMTSDDARGAFKSDKVYHDDVATEIDSLPDSAPHRQVDIPIAKAAKRLGAKAKIAIMIPPTIYGLNPKHGRLSMQLPTLARYALKRGFAGYVGEGLSVHSNVHVLDIARAYVVLMHHMESTAPDNNPQLLNNPYYFCEATGDDEPSWREIAAVIGDSLHEAGAIPDPTPRTIPRDSYGDIYGSETDAGVGMNSRTRALRLRELGWRPVEKDWKASFAEDELPYILKEGSR